MDYGELLGAGEAMKHIRFSILDSRLGSEIKDRKSKIAVYVLCFFLWSVPFVCAGAIAEVEQIAAYAGTLPSVRGEAWESRYYLIEGVHYLLNEGDRDMAEELFRKAIFSSPFSSLSEESGTQDQSRRVVAEAFYFLGKLHYEKAEIAKNSREEPYVQNIAWARKYLKKAEEYGIVYDRLHPPLLGEVDRKYPEIEVPIPESRRDEVATRHAVSVLIEIGDGSYKIDAVEVDRYADVTERKFLTDKEFDLECGARYKMKPDVQGRHRSMYRALTVLGVGLVIWLIRS